MDECDIGSKTAAKFLKHSIALARGDHHAAAGSLVCIGCGLNIPEARRKAVPNCTRCVVCQQKWERAQNGVF